MKEYDLTTAAGRFAAEMAKGSHHIEVGITRSYTITVTFGCGHTSEAPVEAVESLIDALQRAVAEAKRRKNEAPTA